MDDPHFEWDEAKEAENRRKRGVSFHEAQYAFLDPRRVIAEDLAHGKGGERYYGVGRDESGEGVLTVRFTYRRDRIRIIGAG